MENSTRSAVLLSVIAAAMLIHCCLADRQQYKVDESHEQWDFLTNPKAWSYILASDAPLSSAEAPKSALRHRAKASSAPTASSPSVSLTPTAAEAVPSASSSSESPNLSPASPPAQNGSPTIYSVKNFAFAGFCMIVAIWV
uniref:Phytocyanin domain-containing protein n=1 Tax=Picea sitchensis TaxID=3332 RepID=A9NKH3_PICSI|nr:unknown [Picea sitchensis]ABR16779.1 unknown [Picea sitchensis]